MSSLDQRLCPGIGGRKCGVFMSPLFRDPHPTCARCRGRKCTSDMTCDICRGWSVAQWESFHRKHLYSGRNKSIPRHSGVSTASPTIPPLSLASTEAASLLPLSPHPSLTHSLTLRRAWGSERDAGWRSRMRTCVLLSLFVYTYTRKERGEHWRWAGWDWWHLFHPPPPLLLGVEWEGFPHLSHPLLLLTLLPCPVHTCSLSVPPGHGLVAWVERVRVALAFPSPPARKTGRKGEIDPVTAHRRRFLGGRHSFRGLAPRIV